MKPTTKTLARGEETKCGSPPAPTADKPQEFGEECGSKGGVPYRSFALPPTRIIRVTVWHRDLVDGILLETDSGALPRIGGTGMHRDIRQDRFELEPDEVLTGVSIEYGRYLDRISFHSNKKDYGPFGGIGGQIKKRLDAPPGRNVVGFKGRHWEFIDSIQLLVV